jgi:transcriptional regulator with XRE-family HTH domain
MGETRDRGVLASAECIKNLKASQASQRNEEGKVWTLTDVANASGVDPKTVSRFLNQISRVDDVTARSICQALNVNFENVLDFQSFKIKEDRTGQISSVPFRCGIPLGKDSDRIFKGRQVFVDQIVQFLFDRNRPTLVLHGPRRVGKTSFLLNLPRFLPSNLISIYLDMQQGSMTSSEGDFCYGLVRAIIRDTRSQGIQMPPLPSRPEFFAHPYPTLEDWFHVALSLLGECHLLLNLDEFEQISCAIKDQRISDRLLDQLHSMSQHHNRLSFLFSGVQTLEQLGSHWSKYFISVVPMEMHYLEPAEAEDLLLNPDPEFTIRYDPGIVDEILQLTRCQPYLLQLIGFTLVTEANRQQTQTATTELLQAAIQNAFTNGEPYFTNIWTEFTGTTPSEVAAGQNLLLALARRNSQSPIICNAATTAANRRLLRYHVIERINENIDRNQADATWETAHYHIEIPLFEQWVKERAIKI